MSNRRPPRCAAALAVGTVAAGRWLALLATAYFSLFHWMRSEYLEFSHIWQYGLPLLDPRVNSALLWWALHSLFLALVLLPLARWLAPRVPDAGAIRWAAWGALALGLGTRGIVGPIVMRAAMAHPVTVLPGGGELSGGPLVETHLARWALVLTEAWWLLPALVVVFRAVSRTPAEASLRGWRAAGFLILYALVQSPEVPYLLTAGGPRGATLSLPLLAYQLGFGGQEFGYASVLTVLMSAAVLLGGILLSARLRTSAPTADVEPGERSASWGSVAWWGGPVVALLPLALAWFRNPPEPVAEPRLAGWMGISLLTALAAAGWACVLAPPLGELLRTAGPGRWRKALVLGPVLLPSLVWILPAVRVIGEQKGWVDAMVPCAGLIFGAPYLYPGLGALALRRLRGDRSARALLAVGAVVGWTTWTDLMNPLMLTQTAEGARLLPSAIVWKLSLHLWSSPLSAPGWAQSWFVAGGLALAAVALLLGNEDERPHSPQ